MVDVENVSELSAAELMQELKDLGLRTGPITPTTRKIFERKLLRARAEKGITEIQEIGTNTEPEEATQQQTSNSVDFGGISNLSQSSECINDSPSCYYGVCFNYDSVDGSICGAPAVFTDRMQALQLVKKLKQYGARFKAFKTKAEAEEFSLSFNSKACPPATPTSNTSGPADPVSNFKAPKPQELVKLRKIIEQGKTQEFIDLVMANPRYLVSSGDTPTILQEGFRYNGMHVAAKGNKREMCELIVNTLEGEQFWQKFLQNDNKEASVTVLNNKRKSFLVDLYLNTPDKGNYETPLHFACKFGHVDVVEFLVSHPLTNIMPSNKYGETPEQIACSRCSSQNSTIMLKDKIRHLLQDNCYVPVFGSEDNSTPPRLGEPWSPIMSPHDRRLTSFPSPGVQSPQEGVRAYAGPMSPSEAAEFHRLWKTPPSTPEERKRYSNIRRGDSTRGMERIGRNLAHEKGIAWTEFWNFLGSFADLAKPSGLDKLEEYFKKRKRTMLSSDTASVTSPSSNTPVSPLPGGDQILKTPASGRSDVFVSRVDGDSPVENSRERRVVGNQVSPTFQDVDMSDTSSRSELGNTKVPLSSESSPKDECTLSSGDTEERDSVNKVVLDLQKLFITNENPSDISHIIPLSAETPEVKSAVKQGAGHSSEKTFSACKKILFGELISPGDPRIDSENSTEISKTEEPFTPTELSGNKKTFAKKCTQMLHTVTSPQEQERASMDEEFLIDGIKNLRIRNELNSSSDSDLLNKGDDLSSMDSTDAGNISGLLRERLFPVSNGLGAVRSASLGLQHRNRGNGMNIFIVGCQPSKLDIDVLRAVGNAKIERDRYPLVTKWRETVMSYSTKVRDSWPSPGSPRYRIRHRSLPTWSY